MCVCAHFFSHVNARLLKSLITEDLLYWTCQQLRGQEDRQDDGQEDRQEDRQDDGQEDGQEDRQEDGQEDGQEDRQEMSDELREQNIKEQPLALQIILI